MAYFYFHFRDENRSAIDFEDEHRQELKSAKAAREEAIMSLMEAARFDVPEEDSREWVIQVHDGSKNPLLEAKLTLEVKRIGA